MSLHLVVGASGQVGGHLLNAITQAGHKTAGSYFRHPQTDLHQLDIRSKLDTTRLLRQLEPQVVYLPASHTNVDDCERHPEKSFEVNVDGVLSVISAANELNARLVYFSSDYIFDGVAGPYTEDAQPNPISVYGKHKLIAEKEVAERANDWLIIRTTVVYGWEPQGKNFIYRLINSLTRGVEIEVPSDQIGTPTYAPNLADSVVELVRANKQGIYNVAGSQLVSRYEFACEAAKVFDQQETLITPVTTESLRQTAARPLNAGLVTAKASTALLQPPIGFREGLRLMANQREHQCV